MKPSLQHLLMGAASTLGKDVAPHIEDDAPFAVGHVGTIGLILACVAQEADRAVDTAVREQDALRALFAVAAEQPLPGDLRARLAEAAQGARIGFRLSDLEAQNNPLKALLAELLETVEQERFDWAEQLEAQIWDVLRAGAERRALYLPVL